MQIVSKRAGASRHYSRVFRGEFPRAFLLEMEVSGIAIISFYVIRPKILK